MPAVSGFLKLENRYVIAGTLNPATLHIGSGVADARTDAPFLRDHNERPLIPGSGMRGVLRSRLEKILQAIGGNRGCVLFASPSDQTHPTCFTVNDNLLDEFKERHKSRPAAERERLLEQKLLEGDGLCDICRLFGSPLLASKLRIADALPEEPKTQIRDCVGIDRDTETAREHIKYDFEALDAKSFIFRAELENATDKDLALIAILFQEMRNPGIEVGGKKSRGLGRCVLKGELTVHGFEDRTGLMLFLGSGRLGRIPSFENKLKGCLKTYLEVH
jgi:CRISPR-associated RAMP protein (TIGR02581 family)